MHAMKDLHSEDNDAGDGIKNERTILRTSTEDLQSEDNVAVNAVENELTILRTYEDGSAIKVIKTQKTTTFGTFPSHDVEKRFSQISDYETLMSSLLHTKAVVDTKDYDPYDYGNTDNPTTFWGTVFHLMIISFGPAVLTIPRTFQDVGYITGFFLTFAIVFLYAYNLHILVWSEYKLCKLKQVPNMTYSDTLYHAVKEGPQFTQWLAPLAKYSTYVVFVVIWVGCTSFTIVLICQNLQTVYFNAFEREVSTRMVMLYVIGPLWLLCCIRKLCYLVPFSITATSINFLCVLIVIYYIFVDPQPMSKGRAFGSVTNIPLIAGTVLYNLSAAGIIMPLKNEMKEPRRFGSTFGVLSVSYVPVSFSYAIFGLLCCLKYGDTLKESVIQNLPQGEFIAQATILLSALTLICTYPLLAFVVFDVMWNNILKETKTWLPCVMFWEYVVRTLVVAASFVAAYTVPNLSLFLSVSGTVGTSIDGIILPAVMNTLVTWRVTKNKPKFNRVLYKNLVMISIAAILIVAGVANCVYEISSVQER